MENVNTEKEMKSAIMPWLVGILSFLITTIGTLLLNAIGNMSEKLDKVIVQVAQQQIQVDNARETVSEIKTFYQTAIKEFAKHEDIYSVRRPKNEN